MVYTTIKVKQGGCGIKYTDGNVERHALKTPEDGPFMCEIEQAKRLVSLGVAEYVADAPKDDEKLAGHLDAEQLETMTVKELEKLAKDMGVDVSKCKKKADIIAAIVAVEVEVDAEDDEDGEDGEDDDLPPLGAADPE